MLHESSSPILLITAGYLAVGVAAFAGSGWAER